MKYIYSLFILLLALFLAAFIQQNGTELQLKYFSWSTPFLPLSLYMILSFAAGYALAVIVGFSTGLRHRFRASGAERELRQLRAELDEIKNEELKTIKAELETGPADSAPSQDDDEKGDKTDQEKKDAGDKTVLIDKDGEEEK
jgi:uncharacterized integral membrane protein